MIEKSTCMSIAFVTMVYNDEFFLKVWCEYYRNYVPSEDIYVITHGLQPSAEMIAEGCNIVLLERDPKNPHLDRDRFKFINNFCADLTTKYDRVVYNDVDELIALDPDIGDNPVSYILSLPADQQVVSPLGLEIIHRPDLEGSYDYSRAVLSQRRFVRVNGWYTKPCITSVPVIWGPDGHGSSHPELHLDDSLYLFHLKWFDYGFHVQRHKDRLKMRFNDENGREVVIGAGSWGWSEMTYQIFTNAFLRMSLDRGSRGFDFSAHRKRIIDSFIFNALGVYKIDWFADGDLRVIPERFVGLF